jgi:hypothetical protein
MDRAILRMRGPRDPSNEDAPAEEVFPCEVCDLFEARPLERQGHRGGRGRGIVERIFGWMMRWRRLARDGRSRLDASKAVMPAAVKSLLLHCIGYCRMFRTPSR